MHKITYEEVNLKSNLDLWKDLTFPDSEDLFEPENNPPLAIGAFVEGKPVGLITAYAYPIIHQAFIYSIFVAPAHQKKGIGTRLLQMLEEKLTDQDVMRILIRFADWNSDIHQEALRKLLAKANWEAPTRFSVRCHFDVPAFNADWFTKLSTVLPEGYKRFKWSYIKDAEQAQIKRMEVNNVFDELVTPLIPYEPVNSLGLRHGKELIGWMVTQRDKPDTILYSSFFILPKYRHTSLAIKLLTESIRLQQASPIQFALLEVNLTDDVKTWHKFLEKRLVPYAQKVEYSWEARKNFPLKTQTPY